MGGGWGGWLISGEILRDELLPACLPANTIPSHTHPLFPHLFCHNADQAVQCGQQLQPRRSVVQRPPGYGRQQCHSAHTCPVDPWLHGLQGHAIISIQRRRGGSGGSYGVERASEKRVLLFKDEC